MDRGYCRDPESCKYAYSEGDCEVHILHGVDADTGEDVNTQRESAWGWYCQYLHQYKPNRSEQNVLNENVLQAKNISLKIEIEKLNVENKSI